MKVPSAILIPLVLLSAAPAAFAAQHYVVTPMSGRNISAEPEPPISLALTEGIIPQATRSKPFSYALAPHLKVTGDPNYQAGSATFTASAMPAGLELTTGGTVNGLPRTKGDGQGIHVVARYKNQSAQQSYSINVNSVPLAVTTVAVGYMNSCAITPEGAAKCWGGGFLGNGENSGSLYPVQVSGLTSGVTDIVMSTSHSCAIHNGAAKCWGSGQYGLLGSGNTANSLVPVQVVGLESGVTALGTGPETTCAVHQGALKCWGNGSMGTIGNGSISGYHLVPTQVTGLTSGVTSVDGSNYLMCAVHYGAAKCWGYGSFGVLGAGPAYMGGSEVPVQVSGMTAGVTDLAVSSRNVCAVRYGAVSCWGSGDSGKLGTGTTQDTNYPLAVPSLSSGVTKIAGNGNSFCVDHAGVVKCWGAKQFGHISDQSAASFVAVPTAVPGLSGSVGPLDVGVMHACAVQSGQAKCWGTAWGGALGNSINDGIYSAPQVVEE